MVHTRQLRQRWCWTSGSVRGPRLMPVTDLHWYRFCEPITEFSAIPWCHHRFGVKGPWSLHGILWDQVEKILNLEKGYNPAAGPLSVSRSTIGATFSSRMRAGSHWTHVTDVKESGDAVENVMLSATSSSMISLAVGQWWSGEEYLWRVAQVSMCQQYLYCC